MEYVELQGLDSIISWIMGGRAIKIHNPEKIVDLLPLFFSQTKYRSFQRQINMWHFDKIIDGPEKGGYYHPYFLKGHKALCSKMRRNLMDQPKSPRSLKNFSKLKITENFKEKQPSTVTPDKMMTFSELMQNLDNLQSSCDDETDNFKVALHHHAAESIISTGNSNNTRPDNALASTAIDFDIHNNDLDGFAGHDSFSDDDMEPKSQHANHTAQASSMDMIMASEFQFLASSFYPTEMKNTTALDGFSFFTPRPLEEMQADRKEDKLAFPFESKCTDVERRPYNELLADDSATLSYLGLI